MQITVLKNQGFCFGVERTLKIMDQIINDPLTIKPIYIYGHLVHNDYAIAKYQELGVIFLEPDLTELQKITAGTMIFTAHGIDIDVVKMAKKQGLVCFDTTCPFVRKSLQLITKLADEYQTILFLGKHHHPEALAAKGASKHVIVVENSSDIEKHLTGPSPIALTTQTTMSELDINAIKDYINEKGYPITIFESACEATKVRQRELIKTLTTLSAKDIVIIVGDTKSNNTQKLFETARDLSTAVVLKVASVYELPLDIDKYEKVIIASGTSTPNWIVDEVIAKLKND